jgi:hypothetical protein
MTSKKIYFLLTILTGLLATTEMAAQNFGLEVKNNQLIYTFDANGNRIPDYSYCGYRSSENPIPNAQNVVFVSWRDGDASGIIQRAIDYVAGLKPDIHGIRGAVLLDKGTFLLSKNLMIATSGIVLRGSGKTETILVKQGVDRSALIKIEGINNRQNIDSANIAEKYLPVNERKLTTSSALKIKTGDRLTIWRPSTKEWISSIGCDIFGGGISALGWKPGDTDIYWDRTATAVDHNTITIDAPLTTAIDSKYGGGQVITYRWTGRISESGIENLTLQSAYNTRYPKDEDHCWTGISIENAENCWVRNINFIHFAGNAVFLQPTASRVTVEDCISKEPVSEIGGYRRTTFFNMGQLNLFQRCYSENGIHDFAVGFGAPGPNAFVQCEAKNALGFSGSIDAWACGLIYDNVNIDGHNLSFKNLGQAKNGAGWNTANSIFWQCTAAEIECYSPATDAKNRAYGCWSQYSGNGEWDESDNHVQPRSLFYAQLQDRLKKDIAAQALILPKGTEASSSPTVETALSLTKEARIPLLTLEKWINQQAFAPSVENINLLSADKLPSKPMKMKAYVPVISVENGKITADKALIAGGKLDIQWWSGKTKFNYLPKMKPHVTRFVPGREGYGLTDRIDSVVSFLKANNIAVLDHNYGLWYDRRRDDHQRIRRRDGDVWAPLYEQPFGRSGEGIAWDGLSKYDLNRPNEWYWMRLKEFANQAQREGILLFYENFFQHNIIEAGAHWVDSPWRTANNINNPGFPEPVNFAGDKRLFMADIFYDLSNENRRNAYRNYIRQSLNAFAGNNNVVHLISAEYTGPLHFVQFWLDVIDEWQRETGNNAQVALSCTKDVQDAILADAKRAAVVDIIDIRYWHYKNDGTTYEPHGGQNLAPRQHARLQKVGKVTFTEAYKAVNEYRTKYPDKAVTYYAQNFPEMAWAVFMAGGSCPQLPVKDVNFLKTAAGASVAVVNSDTHKILKNKDTDFIIYTTDNKDISIDNEVGRYEIKQIDPTSGKISIYQKTIRAGKNYTFTPNTKGTGVYWFHKL